MLAFRAPNQGLDCGFCRGTAGRGLARKQCFCSQPGMNSPEPDPPSSTDGLLPQDTGEVRRNKTPEDQVANPPRPKSNLKTETPEVPVGVSCLLFMYDVACLLSQHPGSRPLNRQAATRAAMQPASKVARQHARNPINPPASQAVTQPLAHAQAENKVMLQHIETHRIPIFCTVPLPKVPLIPSNCHHRRVMLDKWFPMLDRRVSSVYILLLLLVLLLLIGH